MAVLAPQAVLVTGLAVSLAAASAGGDSCNPDDLAVLVVVNRSGASINVVIANPNTQYGQAGPTITVAVPAGATRYIDLPASLQNLSTGLVSWTYSATAS